MFLFFFFFCFFPSIAWLRLFYHTLSFVKQIPNLEARILDTLASSDETISCICGLLLLPSPLPMFFNRLIAYILLRLSLHSKTLCFSVVRTLLRNGIGESYKCKYYDFKYFILYFYNTYPSMLTILRVNSNCTSRLPQVGTVYPSEGATAIA